VISFVVSAAAVASSSASAKVLSTRASEGIHVLAAM
jgi:hypothetical protein